MGIDRIDDANDPGSIDDGHIKAQPLITAFINEDYILEIPNIPADDLSRHEFVFRMELLKLQKFAEPFILSLHGNKLHIVLTQVVVLRLKCRIFLLQRLLRRKEIRYAAGAGSGPTDYEIDGSYKGGNGRIDHRKT